MDRTNDAQKQDERSRQAAYGEDAREAQKDLKDQVTANVGARLGAVEDVDRGVMRETRSDQVLHPDDERHPNAPETLNADKGAIAAKQSDLSLKNTTEIVDAYSANTSEN